MRAFGVKFRGGSMKYHKSDLSTLDPDEAAATLENWRTSLATEPIMLDTKLKLMPLSYHVRKKNSSVATEMEVACRALFDNSFNFVPTEKEKPPPKRPDVKGLMDLDRSSCLRAGTLILMGDGSSKPVECVRRGDIVLDVDLKPSRVLGCNSFFLGDRSFYGFTPNAGTGSGSSSAFFTEVHLFVRPDRKLNVVSKDAFLEENPVFELLADQIVCLKKGTQFQILGYDPNSHSVVSIDCQLHEEDIGSDPESLSPDTPVYFLEVDSSTGTYFANNFLCRHELPPFELWPNTFTCLQEMLLFDPVTIAKLAQFKLTHSTYAALSKLAKEIATCVQVCLYHGVLGQNERQSQRLAQKATNKEQIEQNLQFVLEHQTLVAFGLLIYSKCGKMLANHLDKPDSMHSTKSINTDAIRNVVKEKIHQFLEVWSFEDEEWCMLHYNSKDLWYYLRQI